MSQETHHKHPSVKEYTFIAFVLFVLTAIEVYLSIAPWLQGPERYGLLVTLLLLFAAAKFFFVVGWFMHLKFDALIYRRLFVAPLIVTIIALGIVVLLTQLHLRPAPVAGATPAPAAAPAAAPAH